MHLVLEFFKGLFLSASEMAPYLLFGFFTAGLLSAFVKTKSIEKHLGGKGIRQVLKASAIGVPLPLCSCSVIPMAASLRRHGASRGATTAFLISTPQTGIDSILVALGIFGPVFALYKAVSAFVSGIIGGALITGLKDEEKEKKINPFAFRDVHSHKKADDGKRLSKALRYGFLTLPRDLAKSLLIGFLAAALISVAIPGDFFSRFIGSDFLGMIVMMLVGIPLYVCATASLPVAAALMAKGFSAGAVLVFLMTGPATNAATIGTVWKMMGRKTAWLYLLSIAFTALLSGIVFDLSFKTVKPYAGFSYWEMPQSINTAGLILLFAVFAVSFYPKLIKKHAEETLCMVEGCSCRGRKNLE